MLTPEYLEDLPEEILRLFYDAEQEILADMARRVSTYDYWIPAAEYQRKKLHEAGVLQEDILKSLSGLTGKSEAELKRLMQEAGTKALRSDTAVYEAAGMTVPEIADSEPLRAILNAGYKATAQTMRNLCQTTARTATMQFENAMDLAWLKVQSGAFDTDSAVRSAIKEFAERGIQSIRYPSGRTDSIEVAVRRAVVTGVNQTAAQLQEELADELGCDLVEVSAHAGARPEHAKWQGRIFSRSGNDPKYPDFKKSTGYGTGAGLCGWNCRHTFGPYIEGSPPVWSEEQLAELNAPKYEYNGKKLTEYEASQQQRYNERQIRRWKREEAAMKAAGLDSSEAAAKVKEWQGRQQEFLAQTGFKRQYVREQVSVVKTVAVTQKSAIIKPIETKGGTDVHYVTRIDVEKYRCVSDRITTDEVIITDERIKHIQERHPGAFEKVEPYLKTALDSPDYILEDKHPNSAIILKLIEDNDIRLQIVLRVHTPQDTAGFKNSIISAWDIGEDRWRNYINNKNILYKRE